MEFEVLKKSHLKRNILIGVLVVAVISAIVLNFTRAKYKVTQSIPLVNGTINYTPYDFKVMAMYQQDDSGEYVEIDAMPSSGYTINEEMSYCTLDNVNHDNEAVLYTNDSGEHVIAGLKKNSKCYLYFDIQKPLLRDEILAGKDIQERNSFSSVLSTNTNGIIYQEQTSDGTTYYFAGDTDENWVSFAGYYWRIIRINEDGSIRMIYNGTTTDQKGTTTQLQESTFSINSSTYDNNAYVGYMYTLNNVHGTGTESGIKKEVDEWYEENLLGEPEEDLLSTEAGFCGDRTRSTSSSSLNNSGGTGTTKTYYGAYIRLVNNKTPTFECSDEEYDLYTVDGSSKGNHALDYPIGLITADEVAYAGGAWDTSNEGYYLYTGNYYWTMSPYDFGGRFASVFFVYSSGALDDYFVNWSDPGVRPVLNLKANVTISRGNGSSSNPYVIS